MKKVSKKMKKMAKAEGGKAKMRLDRPMKKATGGSVLDSTNSGITPSNPMAVGAPKSGK